MRPKTPAQWKIPYEISPEPMAGTVTGLGGVAVASRAFRGMKLPGACDANLGALRRIKLGYTPGEVAETAICALLMGATCVEDVDRLREDPAVTKMLGYEPASARSVRDWLEKSHDAKAVEKARQEAQELDLKSSVPEPTSGLRGLQAVVGAAARAAAARQPGGTPVVATVDLDATVVESGKRAAYRAYTGERGYQPVLAVWAEARAVLATEFRDGNVPAGKDPLDCAQLAFAEIPAGTRALAFRGDSACDNQDLLAWLDDEDRADGPKGVILYAVSARMEPELAASARRVPEQAWTTFGQDADGTLKQWAELDHVPGLASERKDARPRRYIGLRFLKPQGELFDDGHDRKHFAVVTNRTEDGAKVVEWHREKAGTVEHVHDEMKNELAAGRMPSQKFGANAAWFALNALAYNVAAALRAAEPEPEARVARVRTIRYHLLLLGARLSRLSRKITLRFAASKERIARVLRVLEAFPCRVQPTG
jgi:hypothetical protein